MFGKTKFSLPVPAFPSSRWNSSWNSWKSSSWNSWELSSWKSVDDVTMDYWSRISGSCHAWHHQKHSHGWMANFCTIQQGNSSWKLKGFKLKRFKLKNQVEKIELKKGIVEGVFQEQKVEKISNFYRQLNFRNFIFWFFWKMWNFLFEIFKMKLFNK